jgi:hypothetical protein
MARFKHVPRMSTGTPYKKRSLIPPPKWRAKIGALCEVRLSGRFEGSSYYVRIDSIANNGKMIVTAVHPVVRSAIVENPHCKELRTIQAAVDPGLLCEPRDMTERIQRKDLKFGTQVQVAWKDAPGDPVGWWDAILLQVHIDFACDIAFSTSYEGDGYKEVLKNVPMSAIRLLEKNK